MKRHVWNVNNGENFCTIQARTQMAEYGNCNVYSRNFEEKHVILKSIWGSHEVRVYVYVNRIEFGSSRTNNNLDLNFFRQ